MAYDDLPVDAFAFPGPLRDQLVAAILAGAKTSSTGLRLEYDLDGTQPRRPGTRSVLIDSRSRPVAVLELTDIREVAVGDIDLAHARDEGEGYESVAEWRAGHERFWHSPQMRDHLGIPDFTIDDATLAIAERFRVVSRIWRPEEINEALALESAALTAAMRTAGPGADLPTCCPPWTVAEEFAHTAVAVSRTLAMLAAPEPPAGHLVTTSGYYSPDERFGVSGNAARIASAQQTAAGVRLDDLVEWFEHQWREVVQHVADEPAARRVTTRHGDPMLLTDFQVTRVVELAVHGLDLADALGREPWLTDSASDVVEALLLGTTGGPVRAELGWDRAQLLRKTTGRAELTDTERAFLGSRPGTALTLA